MRMNIFPQLLPQRNIFPAEMPRYPNVWLLVAAELVLRRQYAYALRFWERLLDEKLELRDSFYDDVSNPNLRNLLGKPGEGSDFQGRIGPLQFIHDPENPSQDHHHQLHARFYGMSLYQSERFRMNLPDNTGGARSCFVLPASVHYEVSTEDETHPYVDTCPLCGITGEYDLPVDRESQDYCLKIHDPLGLEFLLHGKVRGQKAYWPDGRPVSAIEGFHEDYEIAIQEFTQGIDDCLKLGAVFLGPKEGRKKTLHLREKRI